MTEDGALDVAQEILRGSACSYIFPSILAVDVSTGTKVIVPSLHAWLDVIAMSAVQK